MPACHRYFNPRAYVRHDAPLLKLTEDRYYFNPRAYVRHDTVSSDASSIVTFQSTCLREARQALERDVVEVFNFNPRAYVRHDCAG